MRGTDWKSRGLTGLALLIKVSPETNFEVADCKTAEILLIVNKIS